MKNLLFILLVGCFLPCTLLAQIDATLLQSIKDKDIVKVDSLLKTGINLNAVDEDGANALMWACFYTDTAMVQLLLDRGATSPFGNGGGIYYEKETALATPIKGWYGDLVAIASGEGKADLLKYLLQNKLGGIDEQPIHPINDTFSLWTPLMHAAQNEQGEAILALLEQKAEVTLNNKLGRTASNITEDFVLKKVITKKDYTLLDKFIELKSKINKYEVLYNNRNYSEAITFCKNALKAVEEIYNNAHPRYRENLSDLAVLYRIVGEYEDALFITLEVLENTEKNLGKHHSEYGKRLRALAEIYEVMGEYENALPVALEAKENIEKNLGRQHFHYGIVVSNLARIYESIGKYDDAISLRLIALKNLENNFGKQHSYYGITLYVLARLYETIGDYEKALPLALQALKNLEKSLGKQHSEYGLGVSVLSSLYERMGEHEKAISLYLEFLENIENNFGKKHPYYGGGLNYLVRVYQKIGEYKKALPLYLESLEIVKNSLGKHHPDYGRGLNALAMFYVQIGDYEKALPLYLESLENMRKTLGQQHSHYGIGLHNLADLYITIGKYKKALPLALESLENTEINFGKEHLEYGIALGSLVAIYTKIEKYEKALPLALEALENIAKNIGKQNLSYGSATINLAAIYYSLNNYEKVRPLLIEALETIEISVGKQHSDYGNRLKNLAVFYEKIEEHDKLLPILMELTKNINFNIREHLPFLPEVLQLKWKKKHEDNKAYINSFFMTRALSSDLYQFNAQFKGLTIKNLNNIEENDHYFIKWLSLKRKIGKELDKPIDKRNKNLPTWQKEVFKMEATVMANRGAILSESVNVDNLKTSLQPNEIIIDINHFTYYNPEQTDSIYYVAYLIDPLKDSIQQVRLFEEKELEKVLKGNNSERLSQLSKLYAFRGITDKVDGVIVKGDTTSLFDLIWSPLLPCLKNKERIYFSPSGLLNKINQNAIAISKDSTLIDKFDIATYTNIPSKLNEHKIFKEQEYLLIGGINYDYISIDSDTIQQIVAANPFPILKERSPTITGKWSPLKGAEEEVDNIEKHFQETMAWKGQKLKGTAPTEEKIKNLLSQKKSPRVVHFATHGFFFPDIQDDGKDEQRVFRATDNPMIRSGLILAGANHAWQGKSLKEGAENGILTAYEIQNLNLRNTELVVLSACETGLGEIQGSEGVFGLQRAFKIAGAKYIMMSLWQVPDKETAAFMTAFYEHWLTKNKSIRVAFLDAQKEMKTKYKDPYLWAGFVLIE